MPLHKQRVWNEPVEVTLEEFADKVTRYTWTTCSAWRVGEYVFLNDATSGDGAQEYAVLIADPDRPGGWLQVESWTCSWMEPREVVSYFAKLPTSPFRTPVDVRIEKHVTSARCA
jgi:hypothetical protein